MNSSNPNNFPTKYHLVWGGLLQYEHLEGTHSVHSRTHTCTHNTCQDKVCLRVTNPPSLPETIPPGSTSDFQADEHVPGGADNIIIANLLLSSVSAILCSHSSIPLKDTTSGCRSNWIHTYFTKEK